MHRRRHIDHRMHRHRGALALDAHQPVAPHVAQAGAQIEPARVRLVEQSPVRGELLPGAEARAMVRARPLPGHACAQPIVEFIHRGTATLSMMRLTSAGAISARRNSYTGVKNTRCASTEGSTARTSSGVTWDRPASQATTREARSRALMPRGLAPARISRS